MEEDFSEIYDKILEEQIKKDKKVHSEKKEVQKNKIIFEENDPLQKFLFKLQDKLREKIKEKQKIEEKIGNKQTIEVIDEEGSSKTSNSYIDELVKIDQNADKLPDKKLIKENEDLSNQIQSLRSQITRLSVEGGTWGGGDIGGGGSILPMGTSSCSCLSGTTDRLIADTQTLILNSDGTISFPNDIIITPSGLVDITGDLRTSGRIYQDGNDLQSEIESISAISTSVYTTVKANSASWAVDSTTDTGVRALTSNWQNTFSTVQSNSSTWNYQGTDIKALTGNWQNTYTNFSIQSANNLSLYTTVQNNSASWALDSTIDTGVRALTSNWESTYTTFKNVSSTFLTSETDSQTLSFNESNKLLSISNGNTVSLSALVDNNVTDVSGLCAGSINWNSTYTTVKTNSASWAVDSTTDTGVRALTSNWQNTFTTVQSNSSTWDYQGSDIKALTGNWVGGKSAYTTVQSYSAIWAIDTGSDVSGLSANWENTYTTVSSNSAHWDAAYTTLQANSATWDAGVTGTSEVLIAQVKNAESIELNRGDVVYTFGATGGTMSVKLASASSEATSSKTIGVVNGTIPAGGTGYITTVGRMDQLDLQAFSEGDALWLSPTSGDWTNIRPTQPNHGVYIGVVERANNGNGIAYIKIQNGYELNEIHDILITSVSAGQILRRNTANNLWINTNDSLNWDSVYSTVSSISADWKSVYSTVQANSATTWNYQGTDIKALTGNWQSTYLNLSSYLPLSGGTMTGNLSVLGTATVNGLTQLGNVANTTATIYVDTSKVGINTEVPNKELTVVGDISATGKLYGDGSLLTGIPVGSNYLPLSGGNLTGSLTVAGTISASQTISMSGSRVISGYSQDTTPVYTIRALTQAQYDALVIKDNNTIYFITQ